MTQILNAVFSLFPGIGNDFYSYYLGGYLVAFGKNPYLTAPDFMRLKEELGLSFLVGTGYSYPPFLAQLLSFLAPAISFRALLAGWMVLQAGACIVSYRILSSRLGGSSAHKLLSFFLFIPLYGSIVNGQVNGLILLLWVIYLFRARDDSFIYGAVLGILSAVKVYPVFFVAYPLLRRQYRSLTGFAATGLVLVASARDLWWEYVVQVLPRLALETDTYYLNQSLNGLVSRSSGLWGGSVLIRQIIIVLAATGIFVWGIQQIRKYRLGRFQSEFAVLMMGLLIAGKNSFWNMLPIVVLITILAAQQKHLDHRQHSLFLIAVSITHVLFLGVIFLAQGGLEQVAGILAASGTIAFLILYYCLLSIRIVYLPRKKNSTMRILSVTQK